MKICFPVASNQGLDSPVYGHFGSAPLFMVVDQQTRQVSEVINRDLHHSHGSCSPLRALGGHAVDAIVVGGIGGGALSGLQQAGLTVYQAVAGSIADNLTLLQQAGLAELGTDQVCGGHAHGHSCSH
ncbi:MAG: NifB/NifX family molybdenum-iron cluster-binding protein [Pelovirga sp.]